MNVGLDHTPMLFRATWIRTKVFNGRKGQKGTLLKDETGQVGLLGVGGINGELQGSVRKPSAHSDDFALPGLFIRYRTLYNKQHHSGNRFLDMDFPRWFILAVGCSPTAPC